MPLDVAELNELQAALSRRGLAVRRTAPPFQPPWPPELSERFYRLMGRYSFRLWLRDVLTAEAPSRPEDQARYCSPRASENYWRELVRADLARRDAEGCYLAAWRAGKGGEGGGEPFGALLEWFMAEALAREFGVAAGRRVRLLGSARGGDYDLMAVMEKELVYLEVKSSPPRHLEAGDVSAFLDRVEDVLPQAAFFVVDTWFRLRDKIRPLFEDELRRRRENSSGSSEPGGKAAPEEPFFAHIERELYHHRGRIYLVNAKRDLIDNLKLCWRHHLRCGLGW